MKEPEKPALSDGRESNGPKRRIGFTAEERRAKYQAGVVKVGSL